MNLLTRLNRISPRLCRAFANRRGRLLSHKEVGRLAGLSRQTIIRLSKLDSWEKVTIGQAQRYALACGLNLHRIKSDAYLRAGRFTKALKTKDPNFRKMLNRLLSPPGSTD